MVEKAPAEQLQAKMKKYEDLRLKLNNVLQLIATTERSLSEAEYVLNEVEKLPDDTKLFKQVGFVLVPVEKEKLVEELKAKIAELKASLEKYKRLKEDLEKDLVRLMEEIKKLASQQGGAALGG